MPYQKQGARDAKRADWQYFSVEWWQHGWLAVAFSDTHDTKIARVSFRSFTGLTQANKNDPEEKR